jgi:hypothetical protein
VGENLRVDNAKRNYCENYREVGGAKERKERKKLMERHGGS